MVRDDDEDDMDVGDMIRTASMLQARQMITNNAMAKRKEQLTRWTTSEMNQENTRRRQGRVQFHDADIFLSACMSGDEEEVDELLGKGADINTSTVDGLTALHQSVIDSKPEMVRFLCEKGADVNAQDNEGWTPLHAAACCGNVVIVKYLCERAADLTIINSDKELALDLAEDESCRAYLDEDYKNKGIDPDECRDRELSAMMEDVQKWLKERKFGDVPHPRTGASALHVAAAKGYTQLMEMLIQAGADVHMQDKDGWTPLHAAAHWGEKDSCKILLEHGSSVYESTEGGSTVLEVADKEIVEYLEELEKSVEKRAPAAPLSLPISVLAEKNTRVSPPTPSTPTTTHPHQPHFMSTEQKHALSIKDEKEENESLHSGAKHPRLAEKSPSIEREEEGEKNGAMSTSDRSSEGSVERIRTDRTNSSSAESERSHSSSVRASSEKSVEQSPEEEEEPVHRVSVKIPSVEPVVVDRASSVASSINSSANSDRKNVTSSHAGSSSSPSAENTVSATVPLRSQQPSMWINQRVPLTSSRSTPSSSGSVRSSDVSSPSASSTQSSEEPSHYSSSAASSSASVSELSSAASAATRSRSEYSESVRSGSAIPSSVVSDESESQPPSSRESRASSVRSVPSGSASASGSPTVHVTVKPPVLAPTPSSGATVTRSASTPTTLPWVKTSSSTSSSQSPMSTASEPFTSFLNKDRVSAFKPPVKTLRAPESPQPALPQQSSPARPSFKPQPLSAPMMRPWQGASAATNESEAERRNTARMQRQFRRSTQGVTKEQLEEASRIAAEENKRRSGARIVRLASEEKDTSPDGDSYSTSSRRESGSTVASGNGAAATPTAMVRPSQDRMAPSAGDGNVPYSPSTSTTLTLPANVPSPSSTPSAANIKRKNQALVSTGSRSNRRGTGPVLAEDVHAAVTLRCVAPTSVPSGGGTNGTGTLPLAAYTPSAGVPFQSGGSSGFPLLRSAHSSSIDRQDKAHSVPPQNTTTTSLRSVPVVPPASTRVAPSSRVSGYPSNSHSSSTYSSTTGQSAATNTSTTSYPSQERGSNVQHSVSSSSANLNYRTLYEQQRSENDRLRREMLEMRRAQTENGARRSTGSASLSSRTPSSGVSKSASGTSVDDQERRQFERKIADLEYELKSVNQLRMENQRLKEENGALVRVISKMTI